MSDSSKDAPDRDELFNFVKSTYGDRLTTEELEEVRKGVERIIEMADALRSVKLDYRDEPLPLFKPYRAVD